MGEYKKKKKKELYNSSLKCICTLCFIFIRIRGRGGGGGEKGCEGLKRNFRAKGRGREGGRALSPPLLGGIRNSRFLNLPPLSTFTKFKGFPSLPQDARMQVPFPRYAPRHKSQSAFKLYKFRERSGICRRLVETFNSREKRRGRRRRRRSEKRNFLS